MHMYIVGLVSESIQAKARSLVLLGVYVEKYGWFYLETIAPYVGTWEFDALSVLDLYYRVGARVYDAGPEDVIHYCLGSLHIWSTSNSDPPARIQGGICT
jgi:hypothetical protein